MNLHYYPYKLPFKRTFKTAAGSFDHRTGLFLELSVEGRSIWSEVAPLPGFSLESVEEVRSWLDRHGRKLVSRFDQTSNIDTTDELQSAPPSVQFGLSALFHLHQAERRKMPLFRYLNPKASHTLPVNATLGMTNLDNALKQVSEFYRQGYRTVKIKTGRDIDAEAELLEQINKTFPELTLRLDANRAWELDQAVSNLNRLAAFSPEYCEEPLFNPDSDSLARLREQVEIPIAADESIRKPEEAHNLISNNSVDVLILKPMLLGSVSTIRDITRFAGDHHVPCIFTTSLEAGIGRFLTGHLAAALGSPDHASGLATGSLLEKDVIQDDRFISNGQLQLSKSAGIERFLAVDPREFGL